jgi:AraC-like DNA-binding protein
MTIRDELFRIPDTCRDQHLPMVPSFAAQFRRRGVRGVGIHEVEVPYEIRRLGVPWHIALITFAGEAAFECGGKDGVIQTGDLWVGPADTAYDYRATGPWKFISAALFTAEPFAHLEDAFTHRKLLFDVTHLVSAAEAYLYEASFAQNIKEESARAMAEYISAGITRELGVEDGSACSRTRRRLNRLWEAVHAGPDGDWTLKELAGRMHVSTRQFQRLMREHYGVTTEKLRTRIRMEHARELLVGTDLSMDMIADKVGYESVYSFSKAFKRYFGTPPGSYRRQAHV